MIIHFVEGNLGCPALGRAATEDILEVRWIKMMMDVDPVAGDVYWDPGRSIWNASLLSGAVILGPLYFSWAAVLVSVALLLLTMCGGHSVGFHRRLIHRTFQCNKTVERVLVWLGVLVGMHGPFWVMRSHDLRDWAQRQPREPRESGSQRPVRLR